MEGSWPDLVQVSQPLEPLDLGIGDARNLDVSVKGSRERELLVTSVHDTVLRPELLAMQ